MSSVPPKSNMSFVLSTTKTAVGALTPHLYLNVLESLQLSRANATTGLTCKQMFRAELNYVESTAFFFRMMALFPPPTFPIHPTGPPNGPTQGIPFPQLAIGPFFTTGIPDGSIVPAAPLAPQQSECPTFKRSSPMRLDFGYLTRFIYEVEFLSEPTSHSLDD